MRNEPRKQMLSEELEAVFSECQQSINQAIREYQQDIDSAIEELRQDLGFSKTQMH